MACGVPISTGMLDIYAGQLPGNFYLYHRVMVPEEWLEDYDRYCQKMVLRWDERDKILKARDGK